MTNKETKKDTITIRKAKEEGNYASLSRFLRYDTKSAGRRKSSLSAIYSILKNSEGTESTSLIFFNGEWVRTASIFKQLNLKFNKEIIYETSNWKETS